MCCIALLLCLSVGWLWFAVCGLLAVSSLSNFTCLVAARCCVLFVCYQFVKPNCEVYTGAAGCNKNRHTLYTTYGKVHEDCYRCDTDDSGKLRFDGYEWRTRDNNYWWLIVCLCVCCLLCFLCFHYLCLLNNYWWLLRWHCAARMRMCCSSCSDLLLCHKCSKCSGWLLCRRKDINADHGHDSSPMLMGMRCMM